MHSIWTIFRRVRVSHVHAAGTLIPLKVWWMAVARAVTLEL